MADWCGLLKITTSLRARQGVAIPWIEESTDLASRKIDGIATPVCALVRNDVFFDKYND